ncbi:TetR/AcrR family transcriptional regulator [Labedella populi]|uniref:TetR/AcrR family transcriptional regulator n=1 Tax=Labedella populi TaxID=2498850 RepID=UPI001FB6DD60|nr:TetR/AcrR family transcriptional regulator [Labedella populi]
MTGTGDTVGSGSQRRKPEIRRALIIEAARGVILREGLGATRLRDIALEAGVSVGTVTYHFESVAEILNEVVVLETARFYSSIIEAVDAELDPVIGVRMLVEPLFDDTEAVGDHWRLWSDYWTAVARKPAVAAEYVARIRVWEACLTRTLRRGVEQGVFAVDDPSGLALKLAAYSDGLATQLSQHAPGLTPRIALDWMWRFIQLETGARVDV